MKKKCLSQTLKVLKTFKVTVLRTFDMGYVRYATTKITVRCTFGMGYVRYATTKITVRCTFDMNMFFVLQR